MNIKSLTAIVAVAFTLGACAGNDDSASSGTAQQVDNSNNRQVATTTTTAPKFKPGSQEELNATIGDRVFFDTDQYNLNQEARATVGFWADWMKSHQNVAVTVEGHADERGTREYNLALGARRANAVRDYLSALGVAPNRIETVSFGKERPAVLGSNAEAWSRNRRGALVVR